MNDDETDWLLTLAEGAAVVTAVLEAGNVTRAAERLGMPQSTVTRMFARIQRRLGVALVDRVGRGIEPTSAGRALLPEIRRATEGVAAARAAVVDQLDPETGEVRLGFLHSLGPRDVPALVSTFRERHPAVRFRLRQGAAGGLLAGVRAGELDLALVAPTPSDEELATKPLRSDTLRLAVPLGHRLAGHGRVDLVDAAGEAFVLLTPGHGLREVTDRLFETAGISPAIGFEGEDVATLRGLVSAGLGVAVLMSEPTPGVVELPIRSPRAVRTVSAVWSRERSALPVARRFRDFVVAEGPGLLASAGRRGY
ncbi:MAG TPA: LysR family transcriptional regulator [Pseudonocardia sp.]|nr:LysR family transcriptional regulator [Pseudonocardia sp.]